MTEKILENRALSCFFARELFSLYLEDQLDNARKDQVTEHLRHCHACSSLFEKVSASQKVLRSLSKTEPVPSLIEYVKKEQYFWQDLYERVGWVKWPSSLKWATELSAVALVLVATIHYFPWLNLAKRFSSPADQGPVQVKNALGEVQSAPTPVSHAMEDLEPKSDVPEVAASKAAKPKVAKNQMENTEPDGADDQGSDADAEGPVAHAAKSSVMAGDDVGAESAQTNDTNEKNRAQGEKIAADKTSATPPSVAEAAAGAVAAPVGTSASSKETDTATTSDDETSSDSSGGEHAGYLWRGTIKVNDLNGEVVDSVTKKITDMGGTKAGQVELGWRRGNQRYYHFIIPEENYEKLLNLLNEDGIVQLTKERHPRVIKSGYMRVILTLEESE